MDDDDDGVANSPKARERFGAKRATTGASRAQQWQRASHRMTTHFALCWRDGRAGNRAPQSSAVAMSMPTQHPPQKPVHCTALHNLLQLAQSFSQQRRSRKVRWLVNSPELEAAAATQTHTRQSCCWLWKPCARKSENSAAAAAHSLATRFALLATRARDARPLALCAARAALARTLKKFAHSSFVAARGNTTRARTVCCARVVCVLDNKYMG